MPKVYKAKLKDLKPLANNPNQGSERGDYMLEESLQQGGIGRSIVVSNDNVILGGNHVYEQVGAAFGDDQEVIVVETEGNQLVAVKRKDLPDSDDPRAKALILGDNRAGDFRHYDIELLHRAVDFEIAEIFFKPDELNIMFDQDSESKSKKIKRCPHCGMEL